MKDKKLLILLAIAIIVGAGFYFYSDSALPATNTINTTKEVEFKNCNDFDCYDEYYTELTMQKGLQNAFDDLKQRYQTDPYAVSQCLPLSHSIGRAATKIYDKVSEAYVNGDGFCWSGYYHGVMEGIISREDPKKISMQIDSICSDIPGKASYSFDYYNCVHGLGHGIMYINNNELFDALKQCDNIKGDWEQKSCWSGAIMENVIVDNKNHFTKYLNPEEPLYPCNAVDEKYKETCYLMQTSYMLKVTGYDFSKVFKLCEQAINHTDACFRSLGRDASGNTISDINKTREICMLGKTAHAKSMCVEGAVKDFISYLHDDQSAKDFCQTLPAEMQTDCQATVTSY